MRLRSCFPAVTSLCVLGLAVGAFAQRAPDAGGSVAAGIPDAPMPAQEEQQSAASDSNQHSQASQQTSETPAQSQEDRPPQTKRILGVIPNFRAVSTDEKLPPQTVKEKFMTATSDSFDYSSIFIPLALAGYGLGVNSYPEFGDGADAFGRYLWHAAVDQTVENYMVEFVVPVIARQDTRYYTLGRGGFFKRTGYSLSRVLVTRSDSGREVFNVSEVGGAAAAAGISTTYYPTRERSVGNFATEWSVNVGIDAASFVAKEFWPEINKKLFERKSAVDPAMR
jgi:hypothetical protein